MKKKDYPSIATQPCTTKSVSMKKAENGFVVSKYDDKLGRDRVRIAKTAKEAKQIAVDMLQ